MKLAQILEARYVSREPQFKCKNCDAHFTEREMKTRQGVSGVKYCPNCGGSHHVYARTFTSRITGNSQTVPSELQEARYYNKHPALKWMEDKMSEGVVGEALILSKQQYAELRELLPRELGEPRESYKDGMWWVTENEHGRFTVDLQKLIGPPKEQSLRLTVSSIEEERTIGRAIDFVDRMNEAKYAAPRTTSFTGDFYTGTEGQYWDPNTTIVLRLNEKENRHGTMTARMSVVEEVSGELATEIVKKNHTVSLRIFDEGGWEILGYTTGGDKNKYGDTWTMLESSIKKQRASGILPVRHRLREARYAFSGMNIEDFDRGDKILMTHHTLRGTETRAAEVSIVNHNNLGLVTFTPDYVNKDYLGSGSGAFDPTKIGKKKYGLVKVEITRKRPMYRKTK